MSLKNKPIYTRVAQLKTPEAFRAHLDSLAIDLPFDEHSDNSQDSPYRQIWKLKSGKEIGNRFCILPMEGWDGTTDGKPTEYTRRRWENFAISGAKLLWGCEAVAVQPNGRANPNQLMINEGNLPDFVDLYKLVINRHQECFNRTDDLYVGLQLTHSGRFCKPEKKTPKPQILYNHPILDKKFGLSENYPLMTDEEIEVLIEDYIKAAVLAQKAGFQFVDVKHCHGYLGHEFLSSKTRGGKYGGSFENRTHFLKEIVTGIRKEAPGLEIAVRISVFDWIPFRKGENENGEPEPWGENTPYPFAFGGDSTGTGIDTQELFQFLELLESLEIELVCTTVGSPYYNPHIQRPALFPPSDGYLPPEDPLAGVARQIQITADIKKKFPNLCIVGSAYSYLQEWLPNVGQKVLREKMADFIGLGRMVLSYPELPADVINGETLKRTKICRTFSDCTTAPRNGMISGCFPLDPYYKTLPEAEKLKTLKAK